MTRALIIGYGRAGRRHGAALDKLGIEWFFYDPDVSLLQAANQPRYPVISKSTFNNLDEELQSNRDFDFAIIATPPSLHLSQIKTCLGTGLPVLCEKPLCSLGQLKEAEALLSHPLAHRVMIGFNYRFHPALVAIKRKQEIWSRLGGHFACFSDQYRTDIPEWGLLLDHVSHSIDILLWLSEMETLEVNRATHSHNEAMETWFLDGTMGLHHFNVWESIRKAEVNKRAWVSGPFGNVEVTPAMDEMMSAMYRVFLAHLEGNGGFPICLEDGVRVQRVLEKVMEVVDGQPGKT